MQETVVEEIGQMEEFKEFDLSELEETTTELVDVTGFEGDKAKIAAMKVIEVPSQFSDTGKAPVLKIWTEPIGDVTFGDNKTPLVASEIYNLKIVDGKPKWSDRGNLAELLAKKKVKHPSELKGQEVMLAVRPQKNSTGKFTRNFLGFI